MNFIQYSEKNGLCKDVIWSLYKDRSGNIWIGTDGEGVCKFDGGTFLQYTMEHGLSYNHVSAVYQDNIGRIWFGTYSGGVNIFDGEKFTNINVQWRQNLNTVLSITQDDSGNFWFGTSGGVVCKYDGNKLEHYVISNNPETDNMVFSALNDKSGNIWFGVRGGGIVKYDGEKFTAYTEKDGLLSDNVTVIIEDLDGNIWAGTDEHGISRFDGVSFTNFTEVDGLCSNRILSLSNDSKGRIWIGTDGGGICFYNGTHFRNFTIDQSYGLENNRVFSILEDKDGNIWAGTQTGVNKITVDEMDNLLKVKQYGRLEGFNGIECNRNAIIEDSLGGIWFGTFEGAIKFNPKADIYDNNIPDIYITGVRLFLEEVDWGSLSKETTRWNHLPINLTLPHDQNHITFDYVGINQRITEKVKYRYLLEGAEDRWSPVTEAIEATYLNLSPGEYIFKVKTSLKGGRWSRSPAIFKFEILSAYWQTWWFYLICFASGIALILLLIRKSGYKLKKLS